MYKIKILSQLLSSTTDRTSVLDEINKTSNLNDNYFRKIKDYNFDEVFNKLSETEKIKIIDKKNLLEGINKMETLSFEDIKESDDTIFNKLIFEKAFIKDSSSDSYIFKGKYDGVDCYYKIFFDTKSNKSLIYEFNVYNLINKLEPKYKPIIKNYLINPLNIIKIKFADFKNKYQSSNIEELKKLALWTNNDIYIYIIITEDINGVYLYNLLSYTKDKNKLINIIFETLYGFYLLNSKLKINQNDNNGTNVVVKELSSPEIRTYYFNKLELQRTTNFRVGIYDYDLGVVNNIINEDERLKNDNSNGYINNKLNKQRDIWNLILLVFFVYYNNDLPTAYFPKQKEEKIEKLIKNIIDLNNINDSFAIILKALLLIENKTGNNLSSLLESIKKEELIKGKFWNRYCEENTNCIIPNIPELDIENILINYVIKFYKELNFTSSQAIFAIKYLKYNN